MQSSSSHYTIYASGSSGFVQLFNLCLDVDEFGELTLACCYTHNLEESEVFPGVHPLADTTMEAFSPGSTISIVLVPYDTISGISMEFVVSSHNHYQQHLVLVELEAPVAYLNMTLRGDDNLIAQQLAIVASLF